jgi:hypothetical protein
VIGSINEKLRLCQHIVLCQESFNIHKMTNEQTTKAIEAVRKHFSAMLEKLEKMKAEQQEDLLTSSDEDKKPAEASLAKTDQLIEEIRKSQLSMERVLKNAGT